MKVFLKSQANRIRSVGTFWIAKYTLEQVESIRAHEIDIVLNILPPKGKILEIGAGTGWQAKILETHGYDVCAIDLPSSNYRDNRVWPVTEYNGKNIPYSNETFDIVFSSNVLEHIPRLHEFQREILRVLKPDGCAIHVVPSGSWRFWTAITHVLKFWTFPIVHGEHAGNPLSEIYYFSRHRWVKLFRETGWNVVTQSSNRLFYTGDLIMGTRWSIATRSKLSNVFGSSCHIFVLKKGNSFLQQDMISSN